MPHALRFALEERCAPVVGPLQRPNGAMRIASFAAGFVVGWAVRSTVESSRSLVVDLGAFGLEVGRRARRAMIAERELLEDLWAEAKARASVERERTADAEAGARREAPSREAPRPNGGGPS